MKADYDYDNCIGCGAQMYSIDDDPNGAHNAVCARCRAQDAHDFDAEPNAVYDRAGRLVDAP